MLPNVGKTNKRRTLRSFQYELKQSDLLQYYLGTFKARIISFSDNVILGNAFLLQSLQAYLPKI